MRAHREPFVEVVYGGVKEEVPEATWSFPRQIWRLNRCFELCRREVVARSGKATHLRMTYKLGDKD